MSEKISEFRLMGANEAALFARWEAKERPYPWSEDHFLAAAASNLEKVWVWEEQSYPAGFVSIQQIESEGYILNIMVSPRLRRQGFGFRMIEAIQQRMKASGARELWLDVEEENMPARRLYEKAGFKVSQKRTGAYPRGETAVTYKKNL